MIWNRMISHFLFTRPTLFLCYKRYCVLGLFVYLSLFTQSALATVFETHRKEKKDHYKNLYNCQFTKYTYLYVYTYRLFHHIWFSFFFFIERKKNTRSTLVSSLSLSVHEPASRRWTGMFLLRAKQERNNFQTKTTSRRVLRAPQMASHLNAWCCCEGTQPFSTTSWVG